MKPRAVLRALMETSDESKSEIRMIDDTGWDNPQQLFTEMVTDIFKVCLLHNVGACVTSPNYGDDSRDSAQVIRSADITYKRKGLPHPITNDDMEPSVPDVVKFNTCIAGRTPSQSDNFKRDTFYPYALAVHESGHALGLSDWSLLTTVDDLTILPLNLVWVELPINLDSRLIST